MKRKVEIFDNMKFVRSLREAIVQCNHLREGNQTLRIVERVGKRSYLCRSFITVNFEQALKTT